MDALCYTTINDLKLLIAGELKKVDGLAVDYADQFDMDFLDDAIRYLYVPSSVRTTSRWRSQLFGAVISGTSRSHSYLSLRDADRLRIVCECAEVLLIKDVELSVGRLSVIRLAIDNTESFRR